MKSKIAICVVICLAVFHRSSSKNVGRVGKVTKGADGGVLACSDLEAFLTQVETDYSRECNAKQVARWNYATNVADSTRQTYMQAKNAFAQVQAVAQKRIADEGFLDCEGVDDMTLRELKYLRKHGPGTLTTPEYQRLVDLLTQFESAYAEATICDFEDQEKCDLHLEPDVEQKLQASSDPAELAWYWTQWHDKISSTISTTDFAELVELQNKLAEANDFMDMSELWLHLYDDESEGWTPAQFKETLKTLWSELQPFYSKLHAFVRMQLRNVPEYKDDIKRFGAFPSHFTRHIWSRHWLHLDASTKPYSEIPTLDATRALQLAGLTVRDLFEAGDRFLTGLGLDAMPETFLDESVLERPSDREFICDASAEDMCSGTGNTDFRVKLCADVTMKDMLRASKYTGYVEYFIQYTNKPYMFRSAANPAFFKGIANTFGLVTSTPEYLQCKGGLNLGLDFDCPLTVPYDPKIDINYLYRTALEKFPLLTFALSASAWRSELYGGTLQPADFNRRWHEIREEFTGLRPPTDRNAAGLDAAAVYDIISDDDEFTKQFVGTILQFQIHEALCILAGEYNPDGTSKPLHQCDFADNADVGDKVKEVMAHGFDTPWPLMLEAFTGTRSLSTASMQKFFQPLFAEIDERLTQAGELACFGKGCQPFAQQYVFVEYETEASRLCNNASLASWAYETDLTNEEAERENAAANLRYSQFRNEQWKEMISQFDIESFDESNEKRQLTFLNSVGVAALEQDKLEEFNAILSSMTKIYGTAKVCPFNKRDCDLETEGLNLEPGLENIMANSRSYNELAYVWREWRAATGKLMREDYNRYVDLSNEAAVVNGYANMGDFWIHRYESDTFKSDMEAVWDSVKDIYMELHAYVRFRLRQTYPQMTDPNHPIPAHLLGNMWSQTWSNIYTLVLPYPGAPVFDVTDRMKELYPEGINGVRLMFNIANRFFTSLGLEDMGMSYGSKGMIVKPEDGREVICHASAWDFCDGEDFRIKMCTGIDMEDLITVHHELGHIQYDLQYKHLNITFREGANPGFHEAIGDVIALSVATPKHMYFLDLVDEPVATPESTINYLMKMALDKIAFLPFGFLIDSYRWRVFDGEIPRTNLTYNWLKMRSDFQGIHPPTKRNEEDFDPGAKFHVPADVPYIRYFFSYILQFQIHRELCEVAGQYSPTDPTKPLHNCDIYQNEAAGRKFKQLLESGGSKNWQELLQEVTGESTLNAEPLKQYFEPLIEYFREQRAEHNYPLGWDANAFEEYFGDGDLPSTPYYSTPEVPTDPPTPSPDPETPDPGTTDPSAPTPDPATELTEPPSTPDPVTTDPGRTTGNPVTSDPEEEDDDGGINVVALVIGIVLGVIVVVIIVGYFVMKKLGIGPLAKKGFE